MKASAVPIISFVDEGLGHSSYLVDLGDGRALVIDPPRFPDRHLAAAVDRDLKIAYTADTHSHADYVSGGPELAALGAEFLASRGAKLEVPHRDVDPGDEILLTPTCVSARSRHPATRLITSRTCSSTRATQSRCSAAAR